jgi:hypothetical protein
MHCCPAGYSCRNSSTSICTKDPIPMNTIVKISSMNMCDSVHYCYENDTCCLTTNGEWGCCPDPHAVCCSDHVHCCPNGYTCNITNGTCTSDDQSISVKMPPVAMKRKKQAAVSTISTVNVQCDSNHSCPDNKTCCRLSAGNGTSWGCCPMPNAVCCPDHKHCCPNDYACNDDGTCTDLAIVSMKKKHKAAVIQKAT